MTDLTTEELTEFFRYIWEDTKAFVYLPVEYEGKWTSYMFQWPRQVAGIVRHTLKWSAISANVFYSPALFAVGNPQRKNVMGSHVLWVDFDGNAPENWNDIEKVPAPTLRIMSSIPGHEHIYWKLDEILLDVDKLEERNRSLAYLLGADTSGWDADQILRPPFTTNHKRGKPVTIKEWSK